MKTVLALIIGGAVLALPLAGVAAPDEIQKALTQKAQEARKKVAAAQAAQGTDRQNS